MKNLIFKAKATLLLILTTISTFAQEYWDFGNKYKAYIHTSSGPLMVTMGHASLSSSSFLRRVGGVAFHAVAKPDNTFYLAPNFNISYIPYNEDGARLRIVNGRDTVYPYLPDWQLVPIARFASSTHNSCVSLFGPKSNDIYFDITYHKAFQNTLMGMRLLQADMALMDVFTHSELPQFGGRTILGKGEEIPNESVCQAAATRISNLTSQYEYQSWVLTDNTVTFSINEGDIHFSGTPYYYFWKDINQEKFLKLVDRGIYTTQDTLNALALLKNVKPVEVTGATNALKYQYWLLMQLNPAVYETALNTSQYASLFRYVKKTNAANWTIFLKQIQYVHISPSNVKTPTTIPKSSL